MTGQAVHQTLVVAPLAALGVYAFLRIWRRSGSAELSWDTPSYRVGDVAFGALLASYFLLLIAHPPAERPEVTTSILLTNMMFFAVLSTWILGFLAIRRLNPVLMFGLSAPHFQRKALLSSGLLIAALPVIQFVDILIKSALAGSEKNQDVVQFFVEEATAGDKALIVVTALAVAPFAEELIFRGYLFGIVRQFGGRLAAIGVCSLLFAGIHLHLPSIPSLFLFAVVLSLAYEKTGTLWAPITMHALFNGISLVQLFFWPESVQ